jgi:hypothetical protein
LFKGCTQSELRDAIVATLTAFGARAKWDAEDGDGLPLQIHSNGDVHTLYFGYSGGVYGFFKYIGSHLQCPWMEARIQEGDHWDYSLMCGDADIHSFSTHPQYFSGDDPEAIREYQGNPAELARVWGVPKERIERYVAQWEPVGTEIVESQFPNMKTVVINPETGKTSVVDGELQSKFRLKGKAYPEDMCDYGDCWQLLDFIRALGGDNPDKGSKHRLLFQDNSEIYSVIHPQTASKRRFSLSVFLWDAMAWIVDRIERRH